ncbi:MAG: hypothetical protein HWD92_09605 [Flavobacteriia bacterium]|nr:hypothetical protein [Flavobacteriia bacterium]
MIRFTKLKGLATLCILAFSTLAYAQPRSFTHEPQAFYEELNEYLRDIDDVERDSVEALMLSFQPVWTNLDESVRGNVYSVTDNLLRRNLKDYSSWSDYIRLINYFHNFETLELSQDVWNYFAEFTRRGNQRQHVDLIHNLLKAVSGEVLNVESQFYWEARYAAPDIIVEDKISIAYTDVNMFCSNGTDSMVIKNVTGLYDVADLKFHGDGGTVTWEKSGYSEDSLYAELFSFDLDLSRQYYEVDSARLHSKLYLTSPLLGDYQDRLVISENQVGRRFPVFTSYQSLVIPEIIPNVDYRGGFSVIGENFVASENLPKTAQFTFKYEGKPLFKFRSDLFLINQQQIAASEAYVSVMLGETDSMYHPKCALSYKIETGNLSIVRPTEGIGPTPFHNTFHNLDIFGEQIIWQMNDPKFYFQKMQTSSEETMVFESTEYFRNERFDALSGGFGDNPLFELRRVALARDTADMPIEMAASMLNMSAASAERFLLLMSIQGFVEYNRFNRTVSFTDKLFDYILNSRGRRDFDVIRFVSTAPTGPNAEVSLLNYDMTIAGIRGIALSDSQEVALFPARQMITVHEGLDFDFDGVVVAGRFTYFAQNNFFDYDMFRISMPDIDSMRFKVPEFNARTLPGTRPRLVQVRNTLQDINGELLIDRPNNKSGKEQYHDYPIFKSGTGSFVYYDKKNIHNGAYDRDEFYVELEPFEIDSLDNTSTAGLKFSGVFVSAGIFPDMQQDIRVQEDYSLGFKTSTPPQGLPAYGGVGTFTNDLALSNRGLVGTGIIEYQTVTAQGERFLFFPDSTYGVAQSYLAEARLGQVSTPQATNSNVILDWRPYDDVMYATSQQTPFRMYDEDVNMTAEGTIAYSSSDLRGDATLDFLDARTVSDDFQFYNRSFEAQSMNFKVRPDASSDWAFRMGDARGSVDFNRMKGEFTLNGGEEYMEFKANEYISLMDHADWDIQEKWLEVNHVSGELSPMISVNRTQDSLRFDAQRARFDLVPSLLEAYEVPHMDVADARIFPDSGYVAIEAEADMRRLQNARLIANRETQLHTFSEGSLKVKARNDYRGNAVYEYIDADGVIWPLYFESVKADHGITVGHANVTQEDAFYLSSFFGYYGQVDLRAPDRVLDYKGFILIQHTCENLETDWFRIDSKIDPDDIIIDLPEDNPSTAADNVYTGIYLAPDSSSIYTGFLNRDASRLDQELISATGVLYYDYELSSYIITPRERLENEYYPGSYVAFNNATCVMTGKGKITLHPEPGRAEIQAYGVIEHDLNSDELTMDVALEFDFFFLEDIMDRVATDINADPSASTINLDREAYGIAMSYMFDDEDDRADYFEEVNNFGATEDVPRELENKIFISQMSLAWNEEKRSFLSEGPIGIGNIGDIPVNRKVEGLFEITRNRRRFETYLFLEPSRDYYYWQYVRNSLQFFTPDTETMVLMRDVEPDDRTIERDDDNARYVYGPTSRGRVSLFLRRHGME